jgi:hypothetical protein
MQVALTECRKGGTDFKHAINKMQVALTECSCEKRDRI